MQLRMTTAPFIVFTNFAAVKTITIQITMIIFSSMLLLKPVLVSSYLFKSPPRSIILEMAENEEEKSSKETSSKSYDEFFHLIDFEWGRIFELLALKKVSLPSLVSDEHVSEIVPPPPQS